MPTILRENGYRFYFFSHEPNEPPHIHVDKAGATIKVWLGNITIAKSRGFRSHEIDGILAMVAAHQSVLLEAWYEHFDECNR